MATREEIESWLHIYNQAWIGHEAAEKRRDEKAMAVMSGLYDLALAKLEALGISESELARDEQALTWRLPDAIVVSATSQ